MDNPICSVCDSNRHKLKKNEKKPRGIGLWKMLLQTSEQAADGIYFGWPICNDYLFRPFGFVLWNGFIVSGWIFIISLIVFLICDGISGQSVGKYLTRIVIIDKDSYEKIGILGSIKRNLIFMIPLTAIIACVQLPNDRIGEGFGNSRVTFKRNGKPLLFWINDEVDDEII